MQFYETENFKEATVLNDMTDCDNTIQKFFDELRNFEALVTQLGCFVDNFDDNIKCAFAEISNELNKKLMSLCQEICTKKTQIQRETLKNKSEIFNLTRENRQLSEQVMRLKQQISYMESTIGKNLPPGKAYKMSMISYYKTK